MRPGRSCSPLIRGERCEGQRLAKQGRPFGNLAVPSFGASAVKGVPKPAQPQTDHLAVPSFGASAVKAR